MGATEDLARFVVEADIGKLDVELLQFAKRSFTNYVGLCLYSSHHHSMEPLLEFARQEGGRPRATIIGQGWRTSLAQAALLNGYACSLEGYNDALFPTQLHASPTLWPAAQAIAEERGLSGLHLLGSFLLGLEVTARLAISVHPWHYDAGWRISSTVGVFGSAAAAGKLLGLDTHGMVHALGLAGTQAKGNQESIGSLASVLEEGMTAADGMSAAVLAEKGITASTAILEAKNGFWATMSPQFDASHITRKLGEEWYVWRDGLKPFPTGIPSHPLLEAVIQLRNRDGLRPEDIRSVHGRVNPMLVRLLGSRPQPRTWREAKTSIHHFVAAALADGAVTPLQFAEEKIHDPAIAALRDKFSMEESTEIREDQAEVTITTRDGRTVQARIEHALGSPDNPLDDSHIEEKFRVLASQVIPGHQAEELLDACRHLDEAPDLKAITRLLGPDGEPDLRGGPPTR